MRTESDLDAEAPGDGGAGTVALAISHPGHELRLATWIARVRPTISILTAGSRSGDGRARVGASRRLAEQLNATPGRLFGDHLDRDIYAWIMAGEAQGFVRLAADLADGFVQQKVRTVVTDSWQLYNVTHDLWHLTVRRAASLASQRLGRPIDCLDYEVVPRGMAARAVGPLRYRQSLTPAQVDAKFRMAAEYPEIADEVSSILKLGEQGFLASESLHELRPIAELIPAPGEAPLYERSGEDRVAAGLYASILRWRHVEPIVRALEPALRGFPSAA
jgi:hypothetical protein